MNNLPDLPKTIVKREAKWTTTHFKPWLLSNPLPTGPIEIKQTTKDYLNFKEVKEHQIASLVACKSDKGFWWKVADMGQRNAFDVVWYRNSEAFLVIKFPKGFVVLDVDVFVAESKVSTRKSLTFSRAVELSYPQAGTCN